MRKIENLNKGSKTLPKIENLRKDEIGAYKVQKEFEGDLGTVNEYVNSITNGKYISSDDFERYRTAAQRYKNNYRDYKYLNSSKEESDRWIDNIISSFDANENYYSQFADESDYNRYTKYGNMTSDELLEEYKKSRTGISDGSVSRENAQWLYEQYKTVKNEEDIEIQKYGTNGELRDLTSSDLLDQFLEADKSGDEKTADILYNSIVLRVSKPELDTWLSEKEKSGEDVDSEYMRGIFLGTSRNDLNNDSTYIGDNETKFVLTDENISYEDADTFLNSVVDKQIANGNNYSDAEYDSKMSSAYRSRILYDYDMLEKEVTTIDEFLKTPLEYSPENVELLKRYYLRYAPEYYYDTSRFSGLVHSNLSGHGSIADTIDDGPDAFYIALQEFEKAVEGTLSQYYFLKNETQESNIGQDVRMSDVVTDYESYMDEHNRISKAKEAEYAEIFEKYGYDFTSYHEYKTRKRNEKKAEDRTNKIESAVGQGGIKGIWAGAWRTGASIATNLLSVSSLYGIAKEYVHNSGEDALDYVPIDFNSNSFYMMNFTNTIRGTVTKELEEETDWTLFGKNVTSFLYQTGTSIGDFVAAAALTGGTEWSLLVMGLTSASNTAVETLQNGGTIEQAVGYGIVSGCLEAFFEKFSLGNLKAFDDIGIDTAKKWLINTFKQGFVEATEEGATAAADFFVDNLINGENSEYNRAVEAYVSEGYSLATAQSIALQDSLVDGVFQMLGGGISGTVMGGAAGGARYVSEQKYNSSLITDEELQDYNPDTQEGRDNIQSLVDSVIDWKSSGFADVGSSTLKLADSINYKLDNDEDISLKEIRRLATAVVGAAPAQSEKMNYDKPDDEDIFDSYEIRKNNGKVGNDMIPQIVNTALDMEAEGVFKEDSEIGQRVVDLYSRYVSGGDISRAEISKLYDDLYSLQNNRVDISGDNIIGIESSDGAGSMVVQTRDGNYELSELRIEGEEGELFAAASDYSTEGANAFIEGYEVAKADNSSLTVAEYKAAFDPIYTQSYEGVSTEEVVANNSDNIDVLGDQATGRVLDAAQRDMRAAQYRSEQKESAAINGKHTVMYNGRDAEIVGYASRGNVKIKVGDSIETVSMDLIGSPNGATSYMIDTAKLYSSQKAESYMNNYDGKYDPEIYTRGFRYFYDAGIEGRSFDESVSNMKKLYGDKLDYAAMKRIYENASAHKKKADSKRVKKSEYRSKKGNVHLHVDFSTMTERQKASLKAIEFISEVTGVEFHLYASYKNKQGETVFKDFDGKVKKAPNGWYVDSTVYLDINAGNSNEGVMLYTVAHELTHFIREWSPGKFDVLADFLVDKYAEKGVSIKSLVQAQIEKAEANDRKLSYDKAFEEVVADSMETMLADGDILENLSELASNDLTLFKKIKSYFKQLLEKIRKLYAGMNPNSREGQIVSEMNDSIGKLHALFETALVDASEHLNNSTENSVYKITDSYQEYSNRGYGGLRGVLAKKGLDDLSVKLGNYFPLSALFDSTIRNDNTPLSLETVTKNRVQRKVNNGRFESFFKTGKDAFKTAYGDTKTDVKIEQLGITATLYQDIVSESLSKEMGTGREQSIIDVVPSLREIISNSVLMSVEKVQHTDNKHTSLYGYRLYNFYKYNDGHRTSINCLVSTVIQNLDGTEGHVFKNIENVTIEQGLPGNNTDMSPTSNGDTYTIAQLYKFVKSLDRDNGGIKYNSKNKEKYLFNYTERNDKVPYSFRSGRATSREMLVSALENFVQSQEEFEILDEYRRKIIELDKAEVKLAKLRNEINEMQYAKGKRSEAFTKKLDELRKKARNLADSISKQDEQLLRLESTQALRNLLNRERIRAATSQKETDKRLMKDYREGRKKTALKQDILKQISDIDRVLNRGTKERNVKPDLEKSVGSALKLGKLLFDEYLRNSDIVLNGVKSVTAKEAELLSEYKELLEQREYAKEYRKEEVKSIERNADLSYSEKQKKIDELDSSIKEKRRQIDLKIKELDGKLAEVFERERNSLENTNVSAAIDELSSAYKKLIDSEDEYIKQAYSEVVSNLIDDLKQSLGNVKRGELTLYQLEKVKKVFSAVKHTISTANKIFRQGKTEELQTVVDRVQSEILKNEKQRADPTVAGAAISDAYNDFKVNEMKPVYFFEYLGSQKYLELYKDAAHADGVWAKDLDEVKTFIQETRKKYHYTSWDWKRARTFTLEDGRKFTATLGEILSIYAYSRRTQAIDHMAIGGVQHGKGTKYKPGKKRFERFRTHLEGEKPYNLGFSVINEIINSLNKEQRAYVESVQKYMSDFGKKGNEISRELYGIDLFTEKYYMPIQSVKEYLDNVRQTLQKTPTTVSLKNMGAAKPTTPNANNPMILRAFDDVCVEHLNSMATYHAYVLPIENLQRVYNNVSKEGGYSSTREIIERVLGSSADTYLQNYITDLNGGPQAKGIISPLMSLFSKSMKVAVANSLSVAIQQPTAIIRAMDMINPLHFRPIYDHDNHFNISKTYAEMRKYAPITIVKEIGGHEIGYSKSAYDYVGTNEYGRAGVRGFFTDAQYRKTKLDNASMKFPELMDKFGWCAIWAAVKNEIRASEKYAEGSKEFFEACDIRFTDVIMYTQVYDSVNSRSGYMRSKSDLVKFSTSFKGEPTTTVNMAYNAILKVARTEGRSEKAKATAKAFKTVGIVTLSVLAGAAAYSIVAALRDDDDDETYAKKYGQALKSRLLSDMNPLNMLPFTSDVMSLIDGWDVERPDMTLLSEFIGDIRKFSKAVAEGDLDELTIDDYADYIGDLSNILGLGLKNFYRDAKALTYNVYKRLTDEEKYDSFGDFFDEIAEGFSKGTDEMSEKDIVLGSYLLYKEGDRGAMHETLDDLREIIRKDVLEKYPNISKKGLEAEIESILASKIKSSLREDFLDAYEEGDLKEAKRIQNYLDATELYDDTQTIVDDWIDGKEENENEDWYQTKDGKFYMVEEAYTEGDQDKMTEIVDGLIEEKADTQLEEYPNKPMGQVEKEARSSVRSSFTSRYKKPYLKAYEDGDGAETKRILALLEMTGLYDDVEAKAQDWIEAYEEKKLLNGE
ncbi:MAG: hypothetical protein E7591_00930 [Ruminococcaceae bacterium]|nr:hypothetical protein [Oscillospiraceae bacterium]